MWSFAALHPSRTTEIRKRGVLCCFYEISHLCAYLESRKTLRYGGSARYEMKGEVGMSLHEKEEEQEDA